MTDDVEELELPYAEAIERAYRLAAEGNAEAVMDTLFVEFGSLIELRTPRDEKRIAQAVANGRNR